MSQFRGTAGLEGVAVVLLLASPALAATNCNLGPSPCSGPGVSHGCAGGPPPSSPIAHPTISPCSGGGSFNFTGTQYAATCSNLMGNCANISVPPLRFWAHDNYAGPSGANSGCQLLNTTSDVDWFANAVLDGLASPGAADGRWVLYQTNWVGPAVDGSAAGARTVVEISAPLSTTEGTADHTAWYMLASMSNAGGYDFDRVTGVTGGCTPGDIPAAPVPTVSVVGRTAACTGSPTPTDARANAVDGVNYCNIDIDVSDTAGQWFSEAGANQAPALIAGFQVVYAGAAEPTTSNYASGNWQPVRDPANPTLAMGLIPVGATGPFTVAMPKALGMAYVAVRVVYAAGATANPTGTFDPLSATGPQVTSAVGGHCGPIRFGHPDAVSFDTLTASRSADGVWVRWTTALEQDVNGFVVFRSANPAGSTNPADAVLPWMPAHGTGLAYEFLDRSATSPSDSFYYVIQEQTFSGPGVSSAVLPVNPAGTDGGVSGGRSRARR